MSAGPSDSDRGDATGGDAQDLAQGLAQDLAAAEYVLGTLPAEERVAFARRLSTDDHARTAVQAWERRLAPLILATPEVAPPRGLWERIARALPGMAADDDRIVTLERQVRRWRVAAGAAGLVAAGLGLFAVFGPRPDGEAGERYVAIVASGGALPALIVSVDTRAGTARVRPVKAETPSGKSLELWYVGADQAPKPLGLLSASANRIALPAGARTGEGVFAVSVEPAGGSPSGQPTGPVVYTGQLIRD